MLDTITNVNSVFEQPWYIHVVSSGKEQTITYEKGSNTLARLSLVSETRIGKPVLTNPPFTQTCGVWFFDQGGKQTKQLEFQKDAINAIIDQIPNGTSVDLYLDHCCQYVMPWIWRGFKVTPCYSYRIENLADLDACWKNVRDKTRNEIRKAEKIVHIRTEDTIDTLIMLQEKTFARQGRNNPVNGTALRQLDRELREHNACRLLCAVDDENRIHAAAYFVYDEHCCYYLEGGGDPDLRTSGAASLLLWEGIRFAASVSKSFDFEGSMIEDIERFFRAFGGTPQVYYRVTRLCARHRFIEWIKPMIKKLMGYK